LVLSLLVLSLLVLSVFRVPASPRPAGPVQDRPTRSSSPLPGACQGRSGRPSPEARPVSW